MDTRPMKDEESLTRKLVRGATTGLAIGTMLGTFATYGDVLPPPNLRGGLTTVVGQHGIGLAAFGAATIGVDHLVKNGKMKKENANTALDAACGLVLYYKVITKNLSPTKGVIRLMYYACSTTFVTLCINSA